MASLAMGCLLFLPGARSESWPQFRGPRGDGISAERIRTNWGVEPPRLLWKRAVTNGFSSLAVGQGKVVTQVRSAASGSSQEVVAAWDAETGTVVWSVPLPPVRSTLYDGGGNEGTSTNNGGDGPRSTPTVYGSRVYVLTAWLRLYCLDLGTGQIQWSKDLVSEYGGANITWQSASSPVIEDGKVIVNANSGRQTNNLMAFRAEDGSLAWTVTGRDRMTHSTPVAATILGVRQLVVYAQTNLAGINPTNGAVLWRHACSYNGTSVAASPVVADNLIYASAGYGTGARVVRLARPGTVFTVSQIQRKSGELESHWATPVHHGGYLYGLYGTKEYGSAPLKCVKLDTLEEQWSEEGFGPGGVLMAGGLLMILTDTGQLVLADPDPTAYRERARFQAVSGKCWNVPAISNGRIYVRSTREIAAFDVSVPPPPSLRLGVPQKVAGGRLRISLGNADGGVVEASRAGDVRVYGAGDVTAREADWEPLEQAVEAEGGVLWLETTIGTERQRFLRAIEGPRE